MKVLRAIDEKLEYWLIAGLSLVTVVVVFAQVICRITAGSLPWSEELARYCFIWMVCLGTSYAVKLDKLTKVDMLAGRLHGRAERIVVLLVHGAVLAFSLVIVYFGTKSALTMLRFGQTSPALHIPKGYIYLAAPVGFGLAGIRTLQNSIRYIRSFRRAGAEEQEET